MRRNELDRKSESSGSQCARPPHSTGLICVARFAPEWGGKYGLGAQPETGRQ
jgi:hypothetical protein